MARKFCKKCKFNLRGLVDHVCPECGEPFDPANAETFSKYGPNVLISAYQVFQAVVIGLTIGAVGIAILIFAVGCALWKDFRLDF